MPWRTRRDQDAPLEMWEVLAEEFEKSGQDLPADFDKAAEAARKSKEDFDKAAEAVRKAEAEAARKATAEAARTGQGRKAQAEAAQKARAEAGQKAQEDLNAAWNTAKRNVEKELAGYFHQHPRTALCFSGGGVRSATFGLGVLHGLARAKLGANRESPVPEFDFLSTVSGGGYVGGWFSAWAARKDSTVASAVEELARPEPAATLDPDPGPLLHIRRYCAFLNPKLGALSADTWTLAATMLRNMLLNWLVLIPLFMAVLLAPKVYFSWLGDPATAGETAWALWLGVFSGACGTAYIIAQLPTFSARAGQGETWFFTWALVPLTISAVCLTLHWAWFLRGGVNYPVWFFMRIGAIIHGAGTVAAIALLAVRGRRSLKLSLVGLAAALFSGAVAGLIAYVVSRQFENMFLGDPRDQPLLRLYTCIAVPSVLGAFMMAAVLAVGASSKFTDDQDREWWSRAGAWVMIVTFAWLAMTVSVVYAPLWLTGVIAQISAAATLGLGGIVSRVGFAAKSLAGPKEDKAPGKGGSPAGEILTKLGGPAFLLLLVAILGLVNQRLLDQLNVMLGVLQAWLTELQAQYPAWQAWIPDLPFADDPVTPVFYLAVFLMALAWLSSGFININRFSLHAMYRARLIRTYLGASRPERDLTVNRFTNFDEADNVYMSELTAKPLHIVNMALNLVGGKNLAWQQRKAESFTSSRLRTGSLRVGYQNTAAYGGAERKKKGLTLGSAITISGAAASPNMGYHSSPLVSLIMTLFNARLGWWLANPGAAGKGVWKKDGPTLSLLPIVNEALGRTDDGSTWVYLSDGGHFENLGIYEMVLRRCRTIVVVDGSQDPGYAFEDLGNAVRKARVDLGIAIEFEGGIPISGARDLRNRYCAIGRIRYDLTDAGAPDGTLIYIKACLNGSEPEDVLHYSSLDPMFPQQGTEQLWFNESQFESYRRLGVHIVEKIVERAADAEGSAIEAFVQAAQEYIQTPDGHNGTRLPGPLKTAGSITGTWGGAPLKLTADIRHG